MSDDWTQFGEAEVDRSDPKIAFAFEGAKVYMNNRYQVVVRVSETPSGLMAHLSIKRRDKLPIHDWRDLQRIKNELVGAEVEAMELYPAESQLVDTANQYHLWCFPEAAFPFGFHEGRLVTESEQDGSRQRPFPLFKKPADLVSEEDMARKIRDKFSVSSTGIPKDKRFPADAGQCDDCGGYGCATCNGKGWLVPIPGDPVVARVAGASGVPMGDHIRRCEKEGCGNIIKPDCLAVYCSNECAMEDA